MEKALLRDAFVGFLPHDILYRRKHAFSDAVDGSIGGSVICLHKKIEEYAEIMINSREWDQCLDIYKTNTPVSKESFLYRKIFDSNYPGCSELSKGFWLPKVNDSNGNPILNPSATALPGHVIDDVVE